jgi:hypothetical protein
MYAVIILDVISVTVLVIGLYVVWKERVRFYSLRPFLPAIIFLIISRICDILVEHPSIRMSDYFHLPVGSLELILSASGNIFDTISFSLLIYGFIKIIKYGQAKEKHIQTLERLLPLCSNCKKYRTGDGQWLPIEKYLIDSGSPAITHGICPECSQKLYGYISKNK